MLRKECSSFFRLCLTGECSCICAAEGKMCPSAREWDAASSSCFLQNTHTTTATLFEKEEIVGGRSQRKGIFQILMPGGFLGDTQRRQVIGTVTLRYGRITINCRGCNNKDPRLCSIYCTIFITIPVCIFCFLLCNLITGTENDVIFVPLSSCQKSTYAGNISVSFG